MKSIVSILCHYIRFTNFNKQTLFIFEAFYAIHSTVVIEITPLASIMLVSIKQRVITFE